MPPFRYASSRHALVPALLAFVLLGGCGALNPLRGVEPGPDPAWRGPTRAAIRPSPPPVTPEVPARRAAFEVGPSVRAEAPVLIGSAALAERLRAEGEDWLGIPYRYGGTTRAGMDCSAFVQSYMGDVFGLDLSRTTATQVHEGVEVDKADLAPGDLVFFRRRRTRHVGVYLGGGEFIHASSSHGVIVSSLDERYYERYYWTARRVLDDPSRFALGDPAALRDPAAPRDPAERPATDGASPASGSPSGW